ncbi:hypothetical protein [Corynebacterium sp. NML140438]|uniref:AMIN-like domain-containing (lipo)protein n=1 Tax=Corynebacterium sp. NML140438 TaxID=1906334 RepID=UPI0015A648BC|nr:hypothetical protein [Corynebacterium sp. NML140438]
MFPLPKFAVAALTPCVAGAVLAGCVASPAQDQAATRVGSVHAAPSSTQLRPLGTANASPKTQRPSAPAQLAVAGVRVGTHEGFDRVVVDLVGEGEPGWFVDYTSTPMQEITGKPLKVTGNAFLNINIDGTVYPYELGLDADQIKVDTPAETGNIIDVVNAGTYEGRSRVVVGLRSDLPYSVQVLEHPLRLVVDIVQS